MKEYPFTLLESLLPYVGRYQAEVPADSHTTAGFADWLGKQVEEHPDASIPPEMDRGPHMPLESLLFRYIVQLFRLLKQETKAASEGLPINHLDEFVMLMSVMDIPGIRKNDLVSMNRMETSSGNDMVNRLVRHGYLREEAIGRFRHLYITDTGRGLGYELGRRYNGVAQQLAAPLAAPQLAQLVHLLSRIDRDEELHAGT